jgi:endonuclease YncB( thermonuclease family)
VSGAARVIDGDTIEINGVRIRLEGIDAPEIAQTCPRAWFGTWPCGQDAASQLERIVRDRDVTCVSRGHDLYGRMLGECATAGLPINAHMVRAGMAWAFVRYSSHYVEDEAEARSLKLGIWQATSQPAWEFRADRWSGASSKTPDGCAIKGKITRAGHVYHMPWSPWYAKAHIDAARGERWFCTESEAIAAGWRPAGYR